MSKKFTRTLSGILATILAAQAVIAGDGLAIKAFAEAVSQIDDKISLASEFNEATEGLGDVDYFTVPELTQYNLTDSDFPAVANSLTVSGSAGLLDERDCTKIKVLIFDGNWALQGETTVNADGTFSVTGSGFGYTDTHVKIECDGYLPRYYHNLGYGSYDIGINKLIPGDTTYNEGADNQWSDDVINENDAAYVYSLIGQRKAYGNYEANYDLNGDGMIDDADLDIFTELHYDTYEEDEGYLPELDIDEDGHIFDYDYNYIVQYHYGSWSDTDNFKDYMDIDGDGIITQYDYSHFEYYAAEFAGYGSSDYEYKMGNAIKLTGNSFNHDMSLYNAQLDLNGYNLEVAGTFNFMTSNPDLWEDGYGSTLYLNGGSLYVGGSFNFGQANCYDLIIMQNTNDILRIDGNWMYNTLANCAGYWTAGIIYFYGQNWNVNESAGDRCIYSSGTHQIVFFYPYGKQTILWANTETYLDEYGSTSTGRRFNFDYVDAETGELLGLIFPYGYSSDLYWFRPWFREYEEPDYTLYRSGWEIGNGVHIATGNYSKSFTDLKIESPGVQVDFVRTYNSMSDEQGAFGTGWDFNIDVSKIVIPAPGYYQVVLPDGSNTTFRGDENMGFECLNARSTMKKSEDGYTITNSVQAQYHFNTDGELDWIKDANGNTLTISAIQNNVRTVTDSTGRTYEIHYNSDSLVKKIEDTLTGREVNYAYNGTKLTSVTSVSGGEETYEYDGNGRLNKITNCYDEVTDQVTYLSHGEVDYLINSSGLKQVYTYDKGQKQTGLKEYDGDTLVKTYTYNYDEKYAINTNIVETDGQTYEVDKVTYNLVNGKNKYNEMSQSVDIMGNTTRYERDNNGNVIKTINPDGTFTLARYNIQNNPILQVDESNNVTIYDYDANGINLEKGYQSLHSVSNAYTLWENTADTFDLSQINTADYALTVYEYYEYSTNNATEIAGLIHKITDPEGYVTEYTYYESGFRNGLAASKTILDGDTVVSRVEYDYNEQLQVSKETTSVSLAPNSLVYAVKEYDYDVFNNLTKVRDYGTDTLSDPAVTLAKYDLLGRKTAEYSPNYADKSKGTLYTYNPDNTVKTQTDSEGNTTSYEYNAYGAVTEKTNPDGTINIIEYDGLQREKSAYFKASENSTKQILTATAYEFIRWHSFDVYAGLDTLAEGIQSCSGLQTTMTTYITSEKQVITEALADFRGNISTESFIYYADNGSKITETKRTSAYYKNGQLARTTDALENTTKYEYDFLNKLTKTYIPFDGDSDSVTENQYDKNGNVILTKQTVQEQGSSTPKYSVTENEYNALGLLIKVTLSDGTATGEKNITKYFYNNAGIQTAMRTGLSSDSDSEYLETSYTYDRWMRLVTTTDSTGYNSGTVTYDLNGNILTSTDANGNITTNTYDALNRVLTSVTVHPTASSKNVSKSYTYDNMGRVKKSICNDNEITYAYDSLGRKYQETELIGAKSTIRGFFYEGVSQYVESHFVGINHLLMYSNTSYEYDDEMRIIQVKEGGNEITAYTYDANGNKASETLANGIVSTYAYNKNNRITNITNQLGNVPVSSYEYTYYLDGSDACKVREENGIIEKTSYIYDGLKRLTQESVSVNDVVTDTYTYSYDGYSNRIQMTASGTDNYTTVYNYNDSQGDYTALLQSETRTDEVEEIENPPLPLPQDNVKQTDYTYDANGSQLTKTTSEKTEINTYNAANQLVGFTDGDTTASYTYNADGLRIRKTVGNQTVQHVWDGAKQIIADVVDGEYYQATCYVRGTSLAATYEYVDAVKSEYVYYLQNAHGDVVNLADDEGNVVKTYKYDAFGVEKNISDSDTNAFRYCGEYFDKETGTIYLRVRYYNPSTGRFTQRDSFAGKNEFPLSLNLYTYGHNNPILNTDPSGHIAPLVAAAIILSASAISMWGSNIKQSKEKGGLANVNVSETASVGLATAGGTMAAIATGGAMAAMAPAATSTLGGTIAIGASSSLAGGIATRTSYNLAYNLNTPISNQLDYVLDPRAQAFDMLVGGLTGAAFYGIPKGISVIDSKLAVSKVVKNPDILLKQPELLGKATPEQFYKGFQKGGIGTQPQPLSRGSLKGIPYEQGGGYKINWGGDRLLQYHPSGLTHHGGDAYWKTVVGNRTPSAIRYDLSGNLKP